MGYHKTPLDYRDVRRIVGIVGQPDSNFFTADYLDRIAQLGLNPLEFVRVLTKGGDKRRSPIHQQRAAYVDQQLAEIIACAEKHGFTVGRTPQSRETLNQLRRDLTDWMVE